MDRFPSKLLGFGEVTEFRETEGQVHASHYSGKAARTESLQRKVIAEHVDSPAEQPYCIAELANRAMSAP